MRIVGTIYFTSFDSSAHNADVNDTACGRAIRVAGVHNALVKRIFGLTPPITTQPGETAAAFPPKPESHIAKESLIMDNKDNPLFVRKTAEADRKQQLIELTSNIEQLCLALSMVSPNLVEIHKTDDCNAKQSFDTTWFQKIPGPTLPTKTKPGETIAAPSPSVSSGVSSRFIPKCLTSGHTRANHTTH